MSTNTETTEVKKQGAQVFAFGDPEPVLTNTLTDYRAISVSSTQEYYEPPVSLKGLAKLTNANAHHSRALNFKRDSLVKYYQESPQLSIDEFYKWATDFVTFGMGYFQKVENRFGTLLYLKHLPVINMRRLIEKDRYAMLGSYNKITKFKKGEVLQIKNYDVRQTLYGLPDYLGALQSLLLNEAATLFRRKYYVNGAHMGYVFFMSDPDMDADDEEELKKQITQSKGPGNFRSLFVNMKREGVEADKHIKIMPVGDTPTKDEFERVKNISRNDIISAHGLQPALAGMMPENTGGFGDILKINQVYFENDILPRQIQILAINRMLGQTVVGFNNPVFSTDK